MIKDLPFSSEELNKLFDYNPTTGELFWCSRPLSDFISRPVCKRWNTIYAGKRAGSVRKDGYRRVVIGNKEYNEHRIIWKLAHGEDTGGLPLDHINRNRNDNRLTNLRKVTNKQNQRNKGVSINNSTGVTGISFHRRGYYACIRCWTGKSKNLGVYKDFFEAVCARKSAELKINSRLELGNE